MGPIETIQFNCLLKAGFMDLFGFRKQEEDSVWRRPVIFL